MKERERTTKIFISIYSFRWNYKIVTSYRTRVWGKMMNATNDFSSATP